MTQRILTRKNRHKGGGPGLIAAVRANNVELVKEKLGKRFGRSNVNSIDKETGKSPLIIAAENDFREIFKILLEHNAEIFLTDKTGSTVFNYLNPSTVEILLNYIRTRGHGSVNGVIINIQKPGFIINDSFLLFFSSFLSKFPELDINMSEFYGIKIASLLDWVINSGNFDIQKILFNYLFANTHNVYGINFRNLYAQRKLVLETGRDASEYFFYQIVTHPYFRYISVDITERMVSKNPTVLLLSFITKKILLNDDQIRYIIDRLPTNLDEDTINAFFDILLQKSNTIQNSKMNIIALLISQNYKNFDMLCKRLINSGRIMEFDEAAYNLLGHSTVRVGEYGTNFETFLSLLNSGLSRKSILEYLKTTRSIIYINLGLQSAFFDFILSLAFSYGAKQEIVLELNQFLYSTLPNNIIHERINKIIHIPTYFALWGQGHSISFCTNAINKGRASRLPTSMVILCALYGIDLLDYYLEKSPPLTIEAFDNHCGDSTYNLPLKFKKDVIIRLLNYFEKTTNNAILIFFQNCPIDSEDIYTEYILPLIIRKNAINTELELHHFFGKAMPKGYYFRWLKYRILDIGLISNCAYVVKSLLAIDAYLDLSFLEKVNLSTVDENMQLLLLEHFISKKDDLFLTALANGTNSHIIRKKIADRQMEELLADNKYRIAFTKVFSEKSKTVEPVKLAFIEKIFQRFLEKGDLNKDNFLGEMRKLTIFMLSEDTWKSTDSLSKKHFFELLGKFAFEQIKILEPVEGEKMDLTIEDMYFLYFSIGKIPSDLCTPILATKTFFVDYYDKTHGFNYLRAVIEAIHVHSDIRLPVIRALINKQININAIDKEGNTVLHTALKLNKSDTKQSGICSDDIIDVLIAHPLICPYIKNQAGQSAIDIADRKWVQKIEGSRVGAINVSNIKWKGLTRKWISELVDFYFDTATGNFYNPQNQVYCLSCLAKGARPSACDHVTGHNCSIDFRNKVLDYPRRGGIPPSTNLNLVGRGGESECCARCNEKTAAPHCRYGCGGPYQCNCQLHYGADAYKYFKLYKMIEKFSTYQDSQYFNKLFWDVWLDVTNFSANIPFNREECVHFRQNAERTKTFIPATILDKFPNVEETDIYPSGMKAGVPIPNMRRTDDVINNNLMPKIIDLGDKEEMNNIDFDMYSKFISFRHRKNIKPDFPINVHSDRGVGFVCSTIKENTRIKCINADEQRPEKLCDSYIFPDELGILVSSGDLDHESYILYRDKFMYKELLDLDSTAYPYFIGPSINKPNIMPVQSVCEGGGAQGGTRRRHKPARRTRRASKN